MLIVVIVLFSDVDTHLEWIFQNSTPTGIKSGKNEKH